MKTKANKKVLVGVDYTKSSLNALDYAAFLAKQTKCDLVLFHVYDFPVLHTNAGLYMLDYTAIKRDDLTQLAKLKSKLEKDQPGLNIEIINSNLSFKVYVEELATKKKIHYVVIGLETKSKLSKFIWGTTGVDIAGKIDCPVIIVPEKYKTFRLKKVMSAVDYRQDLKRVIIRKAEKFAAELKMQCDLVHFKTPDEIDFGPEASKVIKDAERMHVITVKAKTFAEGAKKYISENKIDIVALFSRTHSVVYKLFNETNTKAIAFNSDIPVMSIHG